METRHRSQEENFPTYKVLSGKSLQGDPYPDEETYGMVQPWIQNITDTKNTPISQNPCTHQKWLRSSPGMYFPFIKNNVGQAYTSLLWSDNYMIAGAPNGGSVSYSYDQDLCFSTLVDNAVGRLPSGANLVVNIVEFAQLKSLLPSLMEGLLSIPKGLKKRTFKSLAGSHLAYEFGLSPLLGDIRAFFNSWSAIKLKLEHLKKRSNKYVRLYASVPLRLNYVPVPLGNPINGPYGTSYMTGRYGFDVSALSGKYTLGARVYGTISSTYAGSRLASDYFDLSRPLSTAWELVPFSFLIDWFIPISKYLNTYDKKFSEPVMENVKMDEFCASIKYAYIEKFKFYHHWAVTSPGLHSSMAGPFPAGEDYVSYYKRIPGIPPENPRVPFNWSLRRSALSASLVLQRIR